MAASKKTRKPTGRGNGPSSAKLDQMIETAIVDAYGESEQILSFYTMLEDNLALPFKTEMLGVEVTVERIDLSDDEQIVAVCSRGKAKQRVPLFDLPLPSPSPAGADWIAAFRRWAGGGEMTMSDEPATIDRDKLRAAIRRLGPEYVSCMLDDAIELLPLAELERIAKKYIDLNKLRTDSNGQTRTTLLMDVKAFDKASRAGEYYESFMVNSANFTAQAAGTTAWIATCNRLLDRCVAEERKSEPAESRAAFDVLFALLDYIDQGHDDVIFFADEGGSWQVGVDWFNVLPSWFRVLSVTATPAEYAERITSLIRHHCDYDRAKMLAIASASATTEQREALARIPDRQARGQSPRQEAMSEYQYYEFQAIDRPLTAKEMDVLRSYSTRARITPTTFVNDYSWGDFKGDEDAWMDKYFDAFLYLANWGTHVLKLRLPARLLDPTIAKTYCGGEGTTVREKAGKVILSFHSEDEEGGDWIEGEGQLSSLISVRADLARGDLRALYLGWLLRAQAGELDDDDAEPPVPPGLGQLSASLESLAEFLRIDSDLLYVAAEASPPISEVGIQRKQVAAWIRQLPTEEKDKILTSLVTDADQTQVTQLLQRFVKEQGEGDGKPGTTGRTIGELLHAAEECRSERRRMEAGRRAKEKARQDREEAAAKRKHLDSLVGRENKLWGDVDALVATKLPKCYDRAVGILVDLRDLAARGKAGAFTLRIEALREAHAKKPSFIQRLEKAGL